MVKISEVITPTHTKSLCDYGPGTLVREIRTNRIILTVLPGRDIFGVCLDTGALLSDYTISCTPLMKDSAVTLVQE